MKKWIVLVVALAFTQSALAIDLDWSGQFRTEAAMISGFAPDTNADATTTYQGYEIRNPGSNKAQFQTLFLRLRPKAIINDNVSIKTEWWLGNPVTGFYGSDFPGNTRSDQHFYNSTASAGSSITAQRFWAEFNTDIGLLQVGRAPQHWGLGAIAHSGDGLTDRYQSTGDTFRLIAKFGNFSLIPATVKYNMGNGVAGGCKNVAGVGQACDSLTGGMSLTEYQIGLKYENVDEDFEGGVNFVRRIAGPQSDVKWLNGAAGGLNYTIWDIYMKKRAGKFNIGVEAPVFTGRLQGTPYSSFAVATELSFQASDSWSLFGKFGQVPGQKNDTATTPTKWSFAYLNPNYKLGMIMFNYQFRNFGGPNHPNSTATVTSSEGSVRSIYDNPITNARYAMLGAALTADKWVFSTGFITATADEAAVAGSNFFNTWTRSMETNAATSDQSTSLGMEFDLGAKLNWDEFTSIGIDMGLYMPGDFYNYTAQATAQDLGTVFGVVATFGVKF